VTTYSELEKSRVKGQKKGYSFYLGTRKGPETGSRDQKKEILSGVLRKSRRRDGLVENRGCSISCHLRETE